MTEYQAFASLLKAVERVKNDIEMQPYGVDGEAFEARVCPLLMDELIEAYRACLIAQEDVA